MAIHYIFGAAGTGKSWCMYRELLAQAKVHPEKKYLVIVPEQFTLQTQKELVTIDPAQRGIMNIDVLSFLRLASRVFEETGGKERMVLEDTGKSMIVKKIALEQRDRLQLFARNVRKQGFLDEIKSMLSEFYQYGIGGEELEQMKQAASGRPMLEKKLADLEVFYESFQEFLADRYITTEGICDLLREKVPQSSLIAGCTICFDGFTGFTPSQYKLIGTLMQHVAEVYITITMDAQQVSRVQKEHQLFYLSYETRKRMDELAVKSGQDIAEPVILQERARHAACESLAHLGRSLFRYPNRPYAGKPEEIRLFSHPGLDEEISWTVTEIAYLVREKGYRYRDIAVVTGDLESYAQSLQREFERAAIPCFIDRKKTILDNPLVRFISAALELVAQDFTYDTVFQYIKSPLAGISKEEGDILENYVLATGIRRYRTYCKEWSYRYRTRYVLDLVRINEIREKFIAPLKAFYEVMKADSMTVREKMTALYQLLVAQHAEQYLKEQAEQVAETEPLRAREYEQVYRIVLELFDRVVGLLGEDAITLKEFQEILKTGFTEAKVGLVPPGLDQIMAGDIERTRLKDVKVLFFLGVNEGIVPKPVKTGGILSEADRSVFEDCGIELAPGRRKSAFTAEFYLYLALTKPTAVLFLSWRQTDTAGKAMQPSYLIDRVLKLFPELAVEENNGDELYQCLGTDAGFGYFIRGLQEYIHADAKTEDSYFKELYYLYMGQAGLTQKNTVLTPETIAAAAFYRKNSRPLSAEYAKALYGAQLKGSVSRLERYAECAFAHFLSYGLALEERREHQIAMPDIGTLYHNALQLYSQKLKENHITWHTIEAAQSKRLLKEAITQAAQEYENGIFNGTKRDEYLLVRMERILKRTIATVQSQIAAGDFEPAAFEQEFTHADRYLALRGRIDRIDLCEQDGKVYVRVVDYKSGNNLFRLDKLYHGLQLQLSVYMNAALDWAKETQSGEIVPAGMLYYHVDDPIIDKEEGIADYAAAVKMQLAMHGLVNDNTASICHMDHHFYDAAGGLAAAVKSAVMPVETLKGGGLASRSITASTGSMNRLLDAVSEKLHAQSEEIQSGQIDTNPYRMGQENACEWCAYRGACGFDTRLPGYRYRNLARMKNEEVWRKLSEGEESAGREEGELDTGATEGH